MIKIYLDKMQVLPTVPSPTTTNLILKAYTVPIDIAIFINDPII